MLTHIVLFRFDTAEHAQEIAVALEGMKGKVPSLRELEVGLDITRSARSFDLGLVTRFDDQAGLDAYRVHPAHQAVLERIRVVATEVAAVDFETP